MLTITHHHGCHFDFVELLLRGSSSLQVWSFCTCAVKRC